jgi:uncharacterized membrane protein HdeD (DUF308 family)
VREIRSDTQSGAEPAGVLGSTRLAHRIWWLFLLCGLFLIVLGVFTLARSSDSIISLAIIAAVTFVADALLLCLLASLAAEWRGLYILGGVTGLAGLAVLLFIQDGEPFRFAMTMAAVLAWRGFIDILIAWDEVSDFTNTSPPLWAWTLLAVGGVSLLLGLSALITRGESTSLLLLIVGGQAIVRGIGMFAASSRLRVLSSS